MREIRIGVVTMLAAGLFVGSVWLGGPRVTQAWLPAFVRLGAAISDAAAEADATDAGVLGRVTLTVTRVLQAVRSASRRDDVPQQFSGGAAQPARSPAYQLPSHPDASITGPAQGEGRPPAPTRDSGASAGMTAPSGSSPQAAPAATAPSLSTAPVPSSLPSPNAGTSPAPPAEDRVPPASLQPFDDDRRGDRDERTDDDNGGSGGSGGGNSDDSSGSGSSGSGSGSGGSGSGGSVSGGGSGGSGSGGSGSGGGSGGSGGGSGSGGGGGGGRK